MWNIAVFLVGTLALLYVSRRSLLRPRSHGFHRFFAWELMLALFLLNVSDWFSDPLAWHQVISWFLLIVCIIPLLLGVHGLRGSGRPDPGKRTEPELLSFERTTRLVTNGIFKYIRHPLYSSLFVLDWGIFFKEPSPAGFVARLAHHALSPPKGGGPRRRSWQFLASRGGLTEATSITTAIAGSQRTDPLERQCRQGRTGRDARSRRPAKRGPRVASRPRFPSRAG